MSLLMDALKKAELAKRQASRDKAAQPASTQSLELSPMGESPEPFAGEEAVPAPVVGVASTTGTVLPELPSSLELLDQQFMDEAVGRAQQDNKREPVTPPQEAPAAPLPPVIEPSPNLGPSPQQRQAAETQRERDTVQNLFEAKQAPASSRKAAAVMIGIFALLGAAAIGIYFWLQLQPRSGLMPVSNSGNLTATPPRQTISAPLAPPQTTTPATTVAPPPSRPIQEKMAEEEPPSPSPRRAEAETPVSPIKVTTSRLKVDPTVDSAFTALQGGNLAAARTGYEQVLANDPKNADALHGLASIYLRQGQPAQAQDYYLRALEADPKDALAQANLISLNSQIDPVQSESRLKLLLSAQPDSAFLHFYLGNLYARQNRWAEAQQDYYKAMSGEPDNPDYLFNLAVSLDQLHQPKLAAQYYAGALSAADKRPAGFDRQQVSDRLKKLQP